MPRHDGRVIWLTYKPEGNVKKTVYMVRKQLKCLKFQNPTKRQEAMSDYELFFRLERESPMTLVVQILRLEASWQVKLSNDGHNV